MKKILMLLFLFSSKALCVECLIQNNSNHDISFCVTRENHTLTNNVHETKVSPKAQVNVTFNKDEKLTISSHDKKLNHIVLKEDSSYSNVFFPESDNPDIIVQFNSNMFIRKWMIKINTPDMSPRTHHE